MNKITFNVSMSCSHCQKRVEDNISKEKGVQSLTVDLPNKKVEISYDESQTNEEAIKEAIEDLGFDVTK